MQLADEQLEDANLAPIPEGLTPHSLRHTYISLRVALGDDAATIAQDAGHADMGESAADAGDSRDSEDGQMRFDFDG